jgi:hypothetical protein
MLHAALHAECGPLSLYSIRQGSHNDARQQCKRCCSRREHAAGCGSAWLAYAGGRVAGRGAGCDQAVCVLNCPVHLPVPCIESGLVQAVTNLSYYERSDSVIWQHTRAVAHGEEGRGAGPPAEALLSSRIM